VCDADLTTVPEKKGKKEKEEKREKGGVRLGMVEIRSEGTGFAGGGKNVVKREGVAFQV
jgi:nitric oxide synthase-interacting protein